MNHFCVITNCDKDANYDMAQYIKEYFVQRGKTCIIMENILLECDGVEHYTDVDKIPSHIECAIVLGGDGTMIQAAIDLVDEDLPILGVNIGTLGFLTEVEKQNVDGALEKLLRDEYTIENRIMLRQQLQYQEARKATGCRYALNDVVVSKRGNCRLITLEVYIHGELVDVYRADGLIFSTPTGSTGYNLSAGGPVLSPDIHAVVITPICAHSLNKRSLVVDAKDEITLKIGRTKEFQEDTAVIVADGRIIGNLVTGDSVTVNVPEATTQLIKLSDIGFYKRMRDKLNGN